METCREPEPEPEDQIFLNPEEEDEDEEEQEKEEEEEDEEEDAIIFNAWMQQYRGGERQRKKTEEDEEEEDEEEVVGGGGGRPGSCLGHRVRTTTDRRASLPCPSTLSSMQLSRLHSSTRPPVSARVLLHRSSSRRLLPSPLESQPPPPSVFSPTPSAILKRRPSLIHPIPEGTSPERRSQFRRRNVMSLSDAYSVCLICHDDLNRGSGGTQELQCNHTFHKECIEEWLWRKHSCPTCRVQVSVQQSAYDCVKVP